MSTVRVTRSMVRGGTEAAIDLTGGDDVPGAHESTVPRGVPYSMPLGVHAEGADASGMGLAISAVPVRGRGSIPVQLMQDTEEEALCPITCMPFRDDCVGFLAAGTPIIEGRPELCVSRLPCGHKFSCLSLAYHMCARDMRCPMCRAGTDQRMRVTCIPAHIRGAFKKRVDEFLEEEKKELDLRDLAIARAILESDTRWEDDAMDEDFPLRMTVYIYGR